MAENWFVVRTKQAKEVTAAVAIAAEGFQSFLPVKFVNVSHAGKRERAERPLFPRYVFARFDRDLAQFGKINYCRGVASKGLMCDTMDRPVIVRDGIIDKIRDAERAERAKVGEETTGWRPGDKFTLQRGKADVEVTYIGEENGEVLVMTHMLGKDHLVTLPFSSVPAPQKLIDKISA